MKQGSTPKITARDKVRGNDLLCGICDVTLWASVSYGHTIDKRPIVRLARGHVEEYDFDLEIRVWRLSAYAQNKLKGRGRPGPRRQGDRPFVPPNHYFLRQWSAVRCHHCNKTQWLHPDKINFLGLENT